jgi:hypothetical protein
LWQESFFVLGAFAMSGDNRHWYNKRGKIILVSQVATNWFGLSNVVAK